jgi:hypothetical protein
MRSTEEDTFPLAPQRAIALWQKKEMDGTALMRCLVSYESWMVPVSEAAVGEMLRQGELSGVSFSKDPQGVSRLFIFSDGDAYSQFRQAAGGTSQQHFLSTRGTWVFRLPIDGVDFIAIDPASAHEIAYGKHLFPRLKQIADAVEVEEALRELRGSASPSAGLLPLVRDYQCYLLAVWKADERYQMAMAPDQRGRALAAVFTCDDAFDAYAEEVKQQQEGKGELFQMTLTGRQLFERLLGLQLDGLVFNCSGPPEPVAFALQFAEVALNSQPTPQ